MRRVKHNRNECQDSRVSVEDYKIRNKCDVKTALEICSQGRGKENRIHMNDQFWPSTICTPPPSTFAPTLPYVMGRAHEPLFELQTSLQQLPKGVYPLTQNEYQNPIATTVINDKTHEPEP